MVPLKILDVGCGINKYSSKNNEVIGLDLIELPNVDIIHDLNILPYPFENNEFDLIIASHILEHLKNFYEVFLELFRILKPNGILKIIVPHFSSPGAFQDPTHIRFFTLKSFEYISNKKYFAYYHKNKIHFKLLELKFIPFNTRWNKICFHIFNSIKFFYEMHISRLIPPKELEVVLQKQT